MYSNHIPPKRHKKRKEKVVAPVVGLCQWLGCTSGWVVPVVGLYQRLGSVVPVVGLCQWLGCTSGWVVPVVGLYQWLGSVVPVVGFSCTSGWVVPVVGLCQLLGCASGWVAPAVGPACPCSLARCCSLFVCHLGFSFTVPKMSSCFYWSNYLQQLLLINPWPLEFIQADNMTGKEKTESKQTDRQTDERMDSDKATRKQL